MASPNRSSRSLPAVPDVPEETTVDLGEDSSDSPDLSLTEVRLFTLSDLSKCRVHDLRRYVVAFEQVAGDNEGERIRNASRLRVGELRARALRYFVREEIQVAKDLNRLQQEEYAVAASETFEARGQMLEEYKKSVRDGESELARTQAELAEAKSLAEGL